MDIRLVVDCLRIVSSISATRTWTNSPLTFFTEPTRSLGDSLNRPILVESGRGRGVCFCRAFGVDRLTDESNCTESKGSSPSCCFEARNGDDSDTDFSFLKFESIMF